MQTDTPETEVRLVPVIDIVPTQYARIDRQIPVDYSPDAYFRYWSDCLADSGIEGLRPINLWYVPVEQLASAYVLERILHAHRFEDDADDAQNKLDRFSDPEDYLIAFSGGYALYIGDLLICTPRCCGDLNDIVNWQMAADYRHAEEADVWIGHPWITVRYDGARLVLVDPVEEGGWAEWTGEIAIAPEALQQAIGQAKQILLDFYRRLLPIAESVVPAAKAVRITEILTARKRGRDEW